MRRRTSLVAPPLVVALLLTQTGTGHAQRGPINPDWRSLAPQYRVLGDLYLFIQKSGHSLDEKSAILRSVPPVFLLASIPVRPPNGVVADAKYYAVMQPTAGLVTSVNRAGTGVIPTEAVAVFSKFDGPDSVTFRGDLVDSQRTVLAGRINRKDRSVQITLNELLLAQAARLHDKKEDCVLPLYKAEAEKCGGGEFVGCAIVSYIYANDQCSKVPGRE